MPSTGAYKAACRIKASSAKPQLDILQVGIIALNLVGQVLQAENIGAAPSYVSNHYQPRNISAAAGAMADLSLDVNVDPVTAGKIREISKQKEGAVAKEDYDEAKRLKQAIERLKAVGQKVAQLEARKRQVLTRCNIACWVVLMLHRSFSIGGSRLCVNEVGCHLGCSGE